MSDSLAHLEADVVACRSCPRLVAWREQVGREKRAAYRDDDYWARPVPGFGDPDAHLVVVGGSSTFSPSHLSTAVLVW